MNNKKNAKPTKFENDPGKNTVAPLASKLNPKGMKPATAKNINSSYYFGNSNRGNSNRKEKGKSSY